MKKKIYLLALLCVSLSAAGQCVLTGDVTLASQQDIINFREVNCTCATASITGKLSIQGPDITDLSLLNFVTDVSDSVTVFNNPLLSSLNGLDEIVTIGMDLNIVSNPILTNLTGLGKVTEVGGSLIVTENAALISLTGLEALTTVYTNLLITDNPGITDLTGLNNLEAIGYSLIIASNEGLINLKGLEKVDSIPADITIASNISLTSLTGLESVTTCGGGITFLLNDALTDLSGLNNLTSINGSLGFLLNAGLTSFNGLQSLVSVSQDIIIAANDALSNLEGLNNLASVDGYLIFQLNASLVNLKGIEKLTTGVTSLGFIQNPLLTSLSGFENLTSISDDIIITGNDNLTDISALSKISTIPGFLEISDNPLLQMCAMQPVCTFLNNTPENATIENNNTGCDSIEEVLSSCAALPVTLISFEVRKDKTEKGPVSKLRWNTSSETNSDRFEIQYTNNGAKNWNQLGVVMARGESSAVVNYTYLHTDPVNGENLYRLKMIDRDGSFTYSRIESVTYENVTNAVTVFPNPVVDQLTIQTHFSDFQKMEIFNISGKRVFDSAKFGLTSGSVDQFNFTKYSKGIYLLKMTAANGEVITRKVAKE